MKDLPKYNSQYRYIFVCLDIYSRYDFVKLLKKKTSENEKKTSENEKKKFENILQESRQRPEKNTM